MKGKALIPSLILLSLLTVVTLTACTGQKMVTEQEKLTVTRGSISQMVNADGSLSLPQDQKLSFSITGNIAQINVSEGDHITKGMVLARLDASDLERAVKTAELAITAAGNDKTDAGINVKTASITLEQASDVMRKLTYPYTYSTFAFDVPAALDSISTASRLVDTIQQGLQSTLTYDQLNDLKSKLKDAQDSLNTARERLARGEGQDVFNNKTLAVKDFWTLRSAQLDVDKATAALQSAQNQLNKSTLAIEKAKNDRDTAKAMLDKAVITAPFDGLIAAVNIKIGDSVQATNIILPTIEIVNPSNIELAINVDETDIPGVKVGQDAIISVDALPGQKINGKVTFISPLSNVQAGVVLYQVKIAFNAPESLGLKAGMSSSADIVTAQKSNILLLPSRAITQDSSGKFLVKVPGADNTMESKVITTGINDNTNSEITSGLNEGDTVIIERQVAATSSGGLFK